MTSTLSGLAATDADVSDRYTIFGENMSVREMKFTRHWRREGTQTERIQFQL